MSPPKVIAAMLDAGRHAAPPTVEAKNRTAVQPDHQGQSRSTSDLPSDPGMYVASSAGFTKILGQILDFKRSGSLLVSDLTFHVKTAKINEQLLGAHAQTVTGTMPNSILSPRGKSWTME